MRRLAVLLPFALLPLALFLAFMHPATLDITNAGWLIDGTDNGENALGLHAYLHDSAAGVSLRTSLLNAPEGEPLLFTDSNPLLGLVLRPVAGLLPADAQFVGPWMLLCIVLQTLFAWLLLRRHAPGPLALWGGTALLVALPSLFNRYVHANLFAHWLILWALWLFLDRERGARLRWWAPLIAVTALIHNYLLVMIGAVWASAMLERFVMSRGSDRWRTVGQIVVILAMVGFIAWWIGAGGHYLLAGNYGIFAMPIDAPINPANPSFSEFLPSIEQREGRGLEGFQYLGAGLLLLLVVAIAVARRVPSSGAELAVRQRLRWLIPALIVLTALAISNYPDIAGHKLPRFPLPAVLAPALDTIRASGRLFWPVAYTIVLVALLAAFRLGRERAGLLLVALFAIQITDISGMFIAIRATSAAAARHRLYNRTTDPRWATAIAAARDVAFEPAAVTKDLDLFQEVAWRATSLGRPVRTVYAARPSLDSVRRLARDHADFSSGILSPDRLYVLLPEAVVPPGAMSRLTVLDGVRILRPINPSRSSRRSAS